MSGVTIERRDGRLTESEYRAVVVVGGRTIEGEWRFTKRHARADVSELRRALFDADAAEARLAAESERRKRNLRMELDTDRRIPRGAA